MIAQKIVMTIIVFGGVLIALAPWAATRERGANMMALGILMTAPCFVIMLLLEIWWG